MELDFIDTAIAVMMVCEPLETKTIMLFVVGIFAVICIFPLVAEVGVVFNV